MFWLCDLFDLLVLAKKILCYWIPLADSRTMLFLEIGDFIIGPTKQRLIFASIKIVYNLNNHEICCPNLLGYD